jgi:acetolactate synthase I/III small subunit
MSTTEAAGRHTISLYVANKPGVLNRIALVFGRRGYNIDSLVVSESTDADYSYMNIVASGDPETLQQIIKQLNKLVDVVSAKDYSNEDVIQKELALFKINCPPEQRTEVLQIAQTFKAVSEDLTGTTLTLMVTGKSEKIDALKEMLTPYGILELVRTGKVLISRGDHRTSRN